MCSIFKEFELERQRKSRAVEVESWTGGYRLAKTFWCVGQLRTTMTGAVWAKRAQRHSTNVSVRQPDDIGRMSKLSWGRSFRSRLKVERYLQWTRDQPLCMTPRGAEDWILDTWACIYHDHQRDAACISRIPYGFVLLFMIIGLSYITCDFTPPSHPSGPLCISISLVQTLILQFPMLCASVPTAR